MRHWSRWGVKLLGQWSLIREDGHASVSERGDSQHQGGRELGVHGMVNRSEGRINVVMLDKRKMLIRLTQKGRDQEPVVKRHRSQMPNPRRRSPTYPVQVHRRKRGKPVALPEGKASRKASR